MRLFVLLLSLLVASPAWAASTERFKSFLRTTQTARAGFEQKVFDRNRKLVQESAGTFVFHRPGRFRWVYEKPTPQLIVGDGERVWVYDRELNQVTVRRLSSALGSTPAALLAGSSDVEAAFQFSEAPDREGLEWLEAVPRDRDAGFERVRLGFDASSLRAMELVDHFGQTTVLRFSALTRNPRVDPAEFHFVPPPGADVLGER